MAEKIKQGIPWFLILALIGLTAGISFNFSFKIEPPRAESQEAQAAVATTSVTVANATPTLSAIVENPSSHNGSGVGDTAGNPTNAGSNVTWQGTASDANSDYWYLAICKTNAITPVNSGAPTCGGGEWVITSTTTSGNQQIAATSTTGLGDESNAWYAFACDYNSESKCSLSSQGTGTAAENSPFYVNHRPTFTEYVDDSPKNPGQTVTATSTSDDADSNNGDDTIVLCVCLPSGFTCGRTPACTGTNLASSTAVLSNASTTYNISTPKQDTNYGFYGYIIDNHGFCASEGQQDVNSVLTVANVAPTISSSTINLVDSGGSGNLIPKDPGGQTSGYRVEATIEDNNSCEADGGGSEIATSTDATKTITWVYRSGAGAGAGCSADANDCYLAIADCTLGPCGGSGDLNVTTTCTFSLWYVADPTNEAQESQYPSDNWLASVKAVDNNDASSTTECSTGREMDTFLAYDVTESNIPYGTVYPAGTSNEATTTMRALGNVGMDENIDGANMESGANNIAIGQQHYATSTAFTWDGALANIASTSVQQLELDCAKTTSTSSPATANTYWLIKISDTQVAGIYNGTNTIAALTGESAKWQQSQNLEFRI